MHGGAVATTVRTHARTLRGILLISYSFLLFASRDRSCSLMFAPWKMLTGLTRTPRHYDAAYVNTITGKLRKNERGQHEGEYPAGANEGERSSDVVVVFGAEGGNR